MFRANYKVFDFNKRFGHLQPGRSIQVINNTGKPISRSHSLVWLGNDVLLLKYDLIYYRTANFLLKMVSFSKFETGSKY